MGTILKTTNGGASWDLQPSGVTNFLVSVSFADSNNGWVVGSLGTILKTTDGGLIWNLQTSGTTEFLEGIDVIDENIATAVGGNIGVSGTILRTTDGGATWAPQISGTNNKLLEVSFFDSNYGLAVGSEGTILHTTNGGVTFVEEEQIDGIPTEFLLSQNYPNPFNPSTNIKYAISSRQFVSLKVFDIIGNEIATLMDEEKSVGTYELTWNATNLPSGVYFYQLLVSALQSKDGKAGEFIETKKMILLK